MKILAVDDESGALKILLRGITNAAPDAEVISFQDPKEALAWAENNVADVAFLDIQMPEMSGLELAKKLKKEYPHINIIFSTGYSQYALDAMKMHSSGYLLKPISPSEVKAELENLRYPVNSSEKNHIFMKTFGNFEVFVDGKPLEFRREKAKEVLAYLVDRQGSSVTRKALASVVFEDRDYSRKTQVVITQIIKSLRETLDNAKISDLLLCQYNSYAINTEMIACDAYDYLNGIPEGINAFHGEYMMQYSWGEEELYRFYE